MKLLLENWRKYLLTEGAKTIEDLLSLKDEEFGEDLKVYVRMSNNAYPGGVNFSYASIDVDGEVYDLGYDDAIMGVVEIVPASHAEEEGRGPCDGAYQVKWATATDGWGPLLYDVAMEYATKYGNGIIADREEVSWEARPVWDYYLYNRKKDVDNHQLDDLHNTLTPEIEVDNCDQKVAGFHPRVPREDRPPWPDSALSKRYTKEPATTIDELGERFMDQTTKEQT